MTFSLRRSRELLAEVESPTGQRDSLEAAPELVAHLSEALEVIEAMRQALKAQADAMDMQEKRQTEEFHISGEVMWGIWSDAKTQAAEALSLVEEPTP